MKNRKIRPNRAYLKFPWHPKPSSSSFSIPLFSSGAQIWVKAGYWYANDINTATGKSISGEKVNGSVLGLLAGKPIAGYIDSQAPTCKSSKGTNS
ncbi:hypothetical protein V6N12_039191 [Hibiscus sabdariffa]|uniref:Uncharacterized protein n=1 Tax=Hibiscus sabdariffa TaxID=183260 RepID=A0ABR2DZZ6_9ROSI